MPKLLLPLFLVLALLVLLWTWNRSTAELAPLDSDLHSAPAASQAQDSELVAPQDQARVSTEPPPEAPQDEVAKQARKSNPPIRPARSQPEMQTVHVEVLDATGMPVSDLFLIPWQDQGDGRRHEDQTQQRATNGDGIATFSLWAMENPNPFPEGSRKADRWAKQFEWNVSPTATWLKEETVTFQSQVGSPRHFQLRLPASGGLAIELTTKDGSSYAEYAQVHVCFDGGPDQIHNTGARFSNGRAVIPCPPTGMPYSYSIQTVSEYQRIEGTGDPIAPGEGWRTHRVVLDNPAPVLVAQLLYPDGKPLASQNGLARFSDRTNWRVETDANGQVRIPLYAPQPSEIQLLFRIPAHYTGTVAIESKLAPGEHDFGKLYLEEKPVFVQGVLLGPDGQPVPWAKLSVETIGQSKKASRGGWDGMSGKDGQFHVYMDRPGNGPFSIDLAEAFGRGEGYLVLPEPVPFVRGQRGLTLRLVESQSPPPTREMSAEDDPAALRRKSSLRR